MTHDFSKHSTKQLLVLATCLKGTLRNVKCEAIRENVADTLRQVHEKLGIVKHKTVEA